MMLPLSLLRRVPLLSRAASSSTDGAGWGLCSDGLTRWRQLEAAYGADDTEVVKGQAVRVAFEVRAEDGATLLKTQLSYRAGNGSSGVCAALDLGVVGMRLGDK